jgi:outer membrane protein assembly factor BamE (lipoprotein component of BamABCDE complex)
MCTLRRNGASIATDDMPLRFTSTGIAIALVAALTIGACSPRVAVRGNLPRDEQLTKIKIGEQNRNEIAEILGTPSTLGTFDDKVWYYISRKTEKFAFFQEKIIDQQVIAVYFSERDLVQAIHKYNKDDLREISLVNRTTPTAGKDLSFVDQLIGNLGRFGGAGN